jgi:hypothetical protein
MIERSHCAISENILPEIYVTQIYSIEVSMQHTGINYQSVVNALDSRIFKSQ